MITDAVFCPTCRAVPGERCRELLFTSWLLPLRVHQARVDAAKLATARQGVQ